MPSAVAVTFGTAADNLSHDRTLRHLTTAGETAPLVPKAKPIESSEVIYARE